jgi:Tfp pilus assembly protein PilF
MSSMWLVVALLLGAGQAPSQPAESAGTPAAKTFFQQGTAAVRAGDQAKAAALFRKAIDEDPRFAEAHESFINSTESAAYAYDAQKRSGDEAARKRATT